MKRIVIALCLIFVAISSPATLNPAEKAIVLHVKEVVKRQAQELEDVRAKLVWTDKELKDTEPKIIALGLERDKYKQMYESEHDAKMKAEKRVLQLYIVIGIMTVLIGVYAFLKFYLHLPL